MDRRPRDYTGDIEAEDIFPFAVGIVIAALLVYAVCLGFAWLVQSSDDYVTKRNAIIDTFNNLPDETREAIAPLLSNSVSKTNTLKHLKYRWSFGTMFKASVGWFILAEILLFFGCTFGRYWHEKRWNYFLADFPLKTAYGWMLLILCLPLGWPFLLGSALKMRRQYAPKRRAERQELAKLAVKMRTELDGNLQVVQTDDRARKAYVDMRVHKYADAAQYNLRKLQKSLEGYQAQLTDLGTKIQNCQRQINDVQAEIKRCKAIIPDQEATRQDALNEWRQLLTMRGVARITVQRQSKQNKRHLVFLIKVRVPYQNELYDFGDYEVCFYMSKFTCHRVRSGVKLDHTSTTPFYDDSTYDFCFGSRLTEIQDYAKSGMIVEALTLIVDCFHSVNPGHEQYIPDCYRKISNIEKVGKRLRTQALVRRDV